jgi:flagellar biosynthesis/type III secretory pathway ATPase
MLPRVLERAGTAPVGSITALYTVLVDGDDMNEPVADAVRSILDGHIVLSRELAHRHHYPAIDVLQSVSRLAPQLLPTEALLAGGRVRELLAAHRRAEDLINIGAYVQGSDPAVDEARARMGEILAFLQQPTDGAYDPDEALAALTALGSAALPTPLAPADEAFDPLPPGAEIVPA